MTSRIVECSGFDADFVGLANTCAATFDGVPIFLHGLDSEVGLSTETGADLTFFVFVSGVVGTFDGVPIFLHSLDGVSVLSLSTEPVEDLKMFSVSAALLAHTFYVLHHSHYYISAANWNQPLNWQSCSPGFVSFLSLMISVWKTATCWLSAKCLEQKSDHRTCILRLTDLSLYVATAAFDATEVTAKLIHPHPSSFLTVTMRLPAYLWCRSDFHL